MGLKFSTKPCPCQGFLNTAATETNKTGSLASLPPSIKVLSTNFVNFLKLIFLSIIFLSIGSGFFEYKLNNKYPHFLDCLDGCPDWKEEVKKWKIDPNYNLKIWDYPRKTMELSQK